MNSAISSARCTAAHAELQRHMISGRIGSAHPRRLWVSRTAELDLMPPVPAADSIRREPIRTQALASGVLPERQAVRNCHPLVSRTKSEHQMCCSIAQLAQQRRTTKTATRGRPSWGRATGGRRSLKAMSEMQNAPDHAGICCVAGAIAQDDRNRNARSAFMGQGDGRPQAAPQPASQQQSGGGVGSGLGRCLLLTFVRCARPWCHTHIGETFRHVPGACHSLHVCLCPR